MQNQDLANTFDRFAAAVIGDPTQADWLNVAIGHLKPDVPGPTSTRPGSPSMPRGACSQADGSLGNDPVHDQRLVRGRGVVRRRPRGLHASSLPTA